MSEALAHADWPQDSGLLKKVSRWLFTTNHKDIGTLYLLLSLFNFFLAGTMILINRYELFAPGHRLITPDFFQPNDYNAWVYHGVWRCDARVCWNR